MKREKLDDILKTKLQNYESESGVPAWAEMHRRMILTENASGKTSLRRRRKVFLRYGAAAAMALIAISLGFYYLNGPEDNFINKIPVAVQNLSKKYDPVDPKREESSDDKFITDLLTSARKLVVFENIQAASADGIYITAYDPDIVTEDSEEAAENIRSESSSEKTSSSLFSVNPHDRSRYASRNGGRTLRDFAKETKINKGWLAGVYINGASSSASSNSPTRNYSVFSASSPLVEMSYLNKSLDVSAQELKHKYPVSIGFNIRKNLTRRFGIETGLVYSYLESTSEMKGSFNYKYKQKLHYLGIPLYASYSMLSSDKWDLYANAGGMAEITLSARGKTEIFNGDNFASQSTARLSAPGVVWSLGANVGMGYSLIDNLGVYIEPGIGYYFGNDRQPESYRTDNPLMFNLRAGLRVKF